MTHVILVRDDVIGRWLEIREMETVPEAERIRLVNVDGLVRVVQHFYTLLPYYHTDVQEITLYCGEGVGEGGAPKKSTRPEWADMFASYLCSPECKWRSVRIERDPESNTHPHTAIRIKTSAGAGWVLEHLLNKIANVIRIVELTKQDVFPIEVVKHVFRFM